MDEKNELSDIVLNKDDSSNSNKKIILAIATLGVVLIIVVMLMNSINSKGTNNLPQAILPPEPTAQIASENESHKEPLFENVPVVQENKQESTNLDHIAKKLKQESITAQKVKNIEKPIKTTPIVRKHKKIVHSKVLPKKVTKPYKKVTKPYKKVTKPYKKVTKPYKKVTKPYKKSQKSHKKITILKHPYFVQVGSFSRDKPNKKFLNSIKKLGYTYSYHKIRHINKVLVGPFNTRKEANKAKIILRSKVVRGAFLVKL